MREELRRWLNPRSAGARMALLFVVMTIVHYATNPWLKGVLLLTPSDVIRHLMLFQLATFVFISNADPFSLIFGVLILVQMGALLESYWGPRRLWLFVVLSTMVSGLFTVLLALVVPGLANIPFHGGLLVTSAVWVAYGLAVGKGRSNFWGLPVSGDGLALIGVAFVVLMALMQQAWLQAIPALFSLLFTFLYVRLHFPARLFERLGSWRLKRQLSRRTSQLKVVSGGQRNMPSDSDKYLH